jgi:hypothetical protein
MANIRWIQNVLIDGKKASIEVMLGVHRLGDRCYVRINQQPELWFTPAQDFRAAILQQGKDILKDKLAKNTVTNLNGSPFNWD